MTQAYGIHSNNNTIFKKMAKRLFQLLDDMNVFDGENKTSMVGVCGDFVSANKAKGGTHVTMGAPQDVLMQVMNNEVIPVLLLINRADYEKRQGVPVDKIERLDEEANTYTEEEVANLLAKYNFEVTGKEPHLPSIFLWLKDKAQIK